MARIAIVSDIHSNLAALEAVLDDAGAVDGYLCTGDIVGYGPQPNESIARLLDLDARCILGNHDHGVLNLHSVPWFNSVAGEALAWTADQLTPTSLGFLWSLPETRVEEGCWLVHGSPRDVLTEYVLSAEVAERCFDLMAEAVCLIGHTHVPSSFSRPIERGSTTALYQLSGTTETLDGPLKLIINAGSVGQPRDGDPRAAYAILDTTARQYTWHRVPYDVERTQADMRRAHLPAPLIDRLAEGW